MFEIKKKDKGHVASEENEGTIIIFIRYGSSKDEKEGGSKTNVIQIDRYRKTESMAEQ